MTIDNAGDDALTTLGGAEAIASLMDPPKGKPDEDGEEETPEGEAPEGEEEAPEGEEPEGDEEGAEDADPDEEEEPAPRKFKVKADGQDLEVDEPELLAGYSRTADYTKKTQAVAAERKALQAEKDAVAAERREYATTLPQLRKAMENQLGAEPNWDKLRTEHPEQYATTYADWQRNKAAIADVKAEEERAAQVVAQEDAVKLKEHLANEQQAIVKAIPSWKKPDVAKKEAAQMRQYANGLGYEDSTLDGLTDHRVIVMLRKAMLYDRAQAERAKLRSTPAGSGERTPVIRPGSSAGIRKGGKGAKLAANLTRLQKTGDVKDAAAAILEQVFDGGDR